MSKQRLHTNFASLVNPIPSIDYDYESQLLI